MPVGNANFGSIQVSLNAMLTKANFDCWRNCNMWGGGVVLSKGVHVAVVVWGLSMRGYNIFSVYRRASNLANINVIDIWVLHKFYIREVAV